MEAHADYLAFMQWFQNTYPDLYACCWKDITAPIDGEGVTVLKDGMDAETYRSVIKATEEYYRNEHNRSFHS